MKLKITSKSNVIDKVTKETLTPGAVIERDDKRAAAFIKANVAVEVDAKGEEAKVRTLDQLTEDVAKVKSVEELNTLEEIEKAGSARKGAFDLFEKRRAEFDEVANDADKAIDTKPAPKKNTKKK